MQFEICVDNVQSLMIAEQCDIDRIELCGSLALGGVTPNFGFLHYASQHCTKPIYMMIRPRGGDFVFNKAEKAMMIADIQQAKALGIKGVVIGALTPNGDLDLPFLQQLVKEAQGLHITFHRAFDLCRDPQTALEQIIQLGCHYVLTSGQAQSAVMGMDNLKRWVEQASGRINIMAGAGVNAQNAPHIALETKVNALHFSASQLQKSPYALTQGAVMGKHAETDSSLMITQKDKVQAILQAVKSL